MDAPVTLLYDRDFYLWMQQQAAYLRSHQVTHLDFENLAEEIESLEQMLAEPIDLPEN